MKISAIVGTIALVSLLGCAKSQIQGQAFIVTPQRENIKLGLMKVLILPRRQTETYIAERTTELRLLIQAKRQVEEKNLAKINANRVLIAVWEKEHTDLTAQQIKLLGQIKAHRDVIDRATHEAEEYAADADDFKRTVWSRVGKSTGEEMIAYAKRYEAMRVPLEARGKIVLYHLDAAQKANDAIPVLEQEISQLDTQIQRRKRDTNRTLLEIEELNKSAEIAAKKIIEMRSHFFDQIDLTHAIESFVTDADGRFKINQTDADVVLFACAKRSLTSSEEYYAWVLPPSRWNPLFLSNNNLFDIGGADGTEGTYSRHR